MRTAFVSLALVAITIGGAAAADGESITERPQNRFAAELLDTHNAERDRFGAPRLSWNRKLASEAQQWAQVLAKEGRMRHATNDERAGAGENLWMGSAGAYPARNMVKAFIEEKQDFRAGTFPDISRTGNWRDVGHYTQVVWPSTREIGCAVARNSQDDFLVCRYWPAGNTFGVEIRHLAAR
jgi:uncharacterized protein YkwD